MRRTSLLTLLVCLTLAAIATPITLAESPASEEPAQELEAVGLLDWLWQVVEDLWTADEDGTATSTSQDDLPGGTDLEVGPGADPAG